MGVDTIVNIDTQARPFGLLAPPFLPLSTVLRLSINAFLPTMNKNAATSPPAATRPSSRGEGGTTTKRAQFDAVATEVVATPTVPGPTVPLNEFGGVLVTPEQIRAAFQFLDIDKKNRVTADNLRARLGIFYDQLAMKDVKLLLHGQNELTEEYLTTLLLTNEVTNFDPLAEAFKAYDPEETGFVARDMLQFVFERLGFGALTDGDLDVLVACADVDGDGRIGLSDFRSLLLPS
jgi:calmodulin